MAIDLPSETTIANIAISRVGSIEQITSIDAPGNNTAKRIRTAWAQMRRGMLVLHPFNFAIWRTRLNAAADLDAAYGELIGYKLPPDYLRWLPPAFGDRDHYDGELEGGYILTSRAAPLPFRYIRDVPDVTAWSAGFVAGFTELLAQYLAQPVTQSAAMAQWLTETAREAVRTAKRIDGLETGRSSRGGVVVRSDWLTARGSGRFSDYR